jgi:hypothetical protein
MTAAAVSASEALCFARFRLAQFPNAINPELIRIEACGRGVSLPAPSTGPLTGH